MKGTTRTPTREEALAQRRWYVIDGQGQVVGRLATKVAGLLRGKGKATFAPHIDCGDFVVVINAGGVRFTGRKLEQKVYRRHSGYPGGVRSVVAGKALALRPEEVLRQAVEGMLPKNRLGRRLVTKLKIYRGAEHPHEAQMPTAVAIEG